MATKKITFTENLDTMEVSIKWAGAGERTVELGNMSEEIQRRLMVHGFRQKVMDKCSGKMGDHTPEELRGLMELTIDALAGGDWSTRTGDGGIEAEAFVRAVLATVDGVTADEARAKWRELDKAAKAQTRKTPGFKRALAEIHAERAKALEGATGPDLGDLF